MLPSERSNAKLDAVGAPRTEPPEWCPDCGDNPRWYSVDSQGIHFRHSCKGREQHWTNEARADAFVRSLLTNEELEREQENTDAD